MQDDREKKIYRVTVVGSIVNLLLILIKLAAGILGRSSALVADAIHSVSDFVTDVIVILFVRISNQPTDKNHDFGHGKFETFATLIIGFVLLMVGFGIMWSSGTTLLDFFRGAKLESPGWIAFVVAIISLVAKEWLYRYTVFEGRKLNSDAVIANAWHHRSDAYTSIATAIGIGGAVVLGDGWAFLDPLAALVVSGFIMYVAFNLMKPCIDELLERSLPEETEDEILEIIAAFPYVSDPHNLRTRKIGDYCAIDFHIRVDGSYSIEQAHEIATAIERVLKERFGQKSLINIHVEPVKPVQ